MIQFTKLAKYSVNSRGLFLLLSNQSKMDIKLSELSEVTVDDESYSVLGFDFPSKISKNVLKKDDVIGVQIGSY